VAELCTLAFAEVDVSADRWSRVSAWNDLGFEISGSRCCAVFGAEVFNRAFWQRVYIARDAWRSASASPWAWSWSRS
jgi:hypothetical protein